MRHAVLRFLTDEIRHALLQAGVGNLVPEQAHAFNKIALAVRKGQAQRVKHAGQVRVAAEPEARDLIQLEVQLGADDRAGLRIAGIGIHFLLL